MGKDASLSFCENTIIKQLVTGVSVSVWSLRK